MNPIASLLLFPFTPRRVALAQQQAPLRSVYMTHVLGVLSIVAVLVGADRIGVGLGLSSFFGEAFRGNSTGESVLVVMIILAAAELAFMVVAGSMTCWAGRDEPLEETWRFSLRVSWLYVAHLIWVVAGVTGLIMTAAILEPAEQWFLVGFVGAATLIIWSIVSYLRALTARPPVAVNHDPLCEWCGYSLMELDSAGLCPECGRPIADSISGNRRALFAPDRGDPTPLFDVWFRPEALLRTHAVADRSPATVRRFAFLMAATALSGGFAFATPLVLHTPLPLPPASLICATVVMVGCVTAWFAFMLTSLMATFFGWTCTKRIGRNRLAAAWHVGLLAAGIFPNWVGLATASLVFVTLVSPLLSALQGTRVPQGAFMLLWFLANGVVFVLCLRALSRRLRFVQYANR